MNLCSDRHEEVCYEGRNCPACELVGQIDTLKQEKERLQEQNEKLENECENLGLQLETAKAQVTP